MYPKNIYASPHTMIQVKIEICSIVLQQDLEMESAQAYIWLSWTTEYGVAQGMHILRKLGT